MKENGAKCSVFSIFMSFCYEQMKPLAVVWGPRKCLHFWGWLYSFGFHLSILHPLCYALASADLINENCCVILSGGKQS